MGYAPSLRLFKTINKLTDIKTFWSHQFSQIKEEGWAEVLRKLKILIRALPFVSVLLIVQVLRPLIWIRFGYFSVKRIGHFAFDVEYYLTEKELGEQPRKALDLFFFVGESANEHFARMCHRVLRVHPIVKFPYLTSELIPFRSTHCIMPAQRRFGSRDIKGILKKTKPHLHFTKEEEKKGMEFMERIGCSGDQKFVCLIVRDSSYLDQLSFHSDCAYHNYRDSDIDTYEKAALALAEKGYWIFRMGKVVHKPLKTEHPRIPDYAKSPFRSDFLDIWLAAKCYFALSTNTGIGDVSFVFRRPMAVVNALPLGYINTISNRSTIWLPKMIVWKKNKISLTLKEQIQTGVIGFLRTQEYASAGVELIDNSPDDILRTAMELEAKLNGNWKENTEDKELQNKFWSILQTWECFPQLHGQLMSKMPDFFLRENQEWFLA